jgi:hypothetical protein
LNGFGLLKGKRVSFGYDTLAITNPTDVGSVGSGEEIIDFDGVVAYKTTGNGVAINNRIKAKCTSLKGFTIPLSLITRSKENQNDYKKEKLMHSRF